MEAGLIRELFYVTIIELTIFTIIIMIMTNKNKKEINRLNEYKININADINETIPALLEMVVSECFKEYVVLNIEYKNIIYINADLEKEIAKDVGTMVSLRLSPAMLSKVSLYYDLKVISGIIADKVYLMVLAYVVEKNELKDNDQMVN